MGNSPQKGLEEADTKKHQAICVGYELQSTSIEVFDSTIRERTM